MPSFNEKVYALVKRIPAGQVTSYGRIARLLATPHGARAVGWALAQLPDGTDVPWQRVINAGGFISTPPIGGTAAEQRSRLESEGIMFDAEGRVDLLHYLWNPPIWEVEDLWKEE